MDTDKQVRIVGVDDVRTLLEREEDIRLASIDHLNIGELLAQEFPHEERHLEVEVLLLRDFAHRTRVFAAVPRIDNDGKGLLRRCFGKGRERQQPTAAKNKNKEKYGFCYTHRRTI